MAMDLKTNKIRLSLFWLHKSCWRTKNRNFKGTSIEKRKTWL